MNKFNFQTIKSNVQYFFSFIQFNLFSFYALQYPAIFKMVIFLHLFFIIQFQYFQLLYCTQLLAFQQDLNKMCYFLQIFILYFHLPTYLFYLAFNLLNNRDLFFVTHLMSNSILVFQLILIYTLNFS